MATIKDIANAAGVSVATVSHVVNNTRLSVLNYVNELKKRLQMQKLLRKFCGQKKEKCRKKSGKKNKMLMEEQKAIVADAGPEFISILHHLLLPTLTVLLNRNYVNWQGSRDVNWFV